MASSRFAEKTALVTGGSRGLGLLIAEELGRRGCRVVMCARDADELARAKARLVSQGVEAATVVCDVTDPGAGERLLAEVEKRFGTLDVLVNNAGVIQVGPLEAMSDQDFDKALEVMSTAPQRLCLAVLPGMRGRHDGTIINIASIGGRIPVPHLLPYATAKFALAGFSSGLRAELAGEGVSVTTVFPGLMRTGSHTAARFSGRASREYAWFSTLASLPLISGSARRAARAIVRAAERGRPELVFTPGAKVATRIYGLAPATTTRLIGAVGRLLPAAGPEPDHNVPGAQTASRHNRLLSSVTVLGDRAGRRNNEVAG